MTIIAISILLFFNREKIDRHSNATYLIATKRKAKKARHKAENEYEKYKIIQDKKFVSDFDKLLIETEKLENK